MHDRPEFRTNDFRLNDFRPNGGKSKKKLASLRNAESAALAVLTYSTPEGTQSVHARQSQSANQPLQLSSAYLIARSLVAIIGNCLGKPDAAVAESFATSTSTAADSSKMSTKPVILQATAKHTSTVRSHTRKHSITMHTCCADCVAHCVCNFVAMFTNWKINMHNHTADLPARTG